MTDREIIKALEHCIKFIDCTECPYKGITKCSVEADALDLINRQQAEIAEYQKHIDNDIIYVKRVKSEAIKEFAERLKKRKHSNSLDGRIVFFDVVEVDDIDTLVKEMTSKTKTEKCDCFCEEQRIKGWLDGNTPITEPITVCNGTRERDECTCGGDKSKCDFYAKDYSYGY